MTNNPTKEIFASSGIYDNKPYANQPYAPDIPNSLLANNNTQITTTSPPSTQQGSLLNHVLFENSALLHSQTVYIDDMLVFNNYIHYDNSINNVKSFNPAGFLQQAIVSFNIFNMGNR